MFESRRIPELSLHRTETQEYEAIWRRKQQVKHTVLNLIYIFYENIVHQSSYLSNQLILLYFVDKFATKQKKGDILTKKLILNLKIFS